MDSVEKLTKLFESFPGIGPRQAKRFVYYLLSKDPNYLSEISLLIKDIKKDISQCTLCKKFFSKKQSENICNICSNPERNPEELMVVSKDSELIAIEKSGIYKGYYFVLGGLIPILEKEPEKRIRIAALKERISKAKEKGLKEIILALSTTSEGENTEEYLKKELGIYGLKITVLGRGISSGAEIEYIDSDTLKGALENKK
jgi:recombination protein RecR